MLMDRDTILILDFGSQYTQLIARRIRESKVYFKILPYHTPISEIKSLKPKGIILSGGPASVYDKMAPQGEVQIFKLNIPILAICYGMQWMVYALEGNVVQADKQEYGKTSIEILNSSSLFQNLKKNFLVWMSHGDYITEIPSGFEVIAQSVNTPVAGIMNKEKKLYGVQFHPEVTHTNYGDEIIKNYLYEICNCSPIWNMKSFLESACEDIKKTVGKKKVFCALSGGVDSSTVAVLINKAIGEQLTCIFIDNGLLRKDEAERVIRVFKNSFNINLVWVDAKKSFLKKLHKVINPEEKRKIIGREFISVFEKEAAKLDGVEFLAQGTLYPDVIESVSIKGPSAIIKTHHNVGGLPSTMKLKLIEPLRDLFKDEVRLLAEELNLPDEIVWQHPFPGPGLGVRIIGEITEERLRILRESDYIVDQEIRNSGLYRDVWQAFAVLLPIKTVGVMGDKRTYEYVIAIRVVQSYDGMTADWVSLPSDVLDKMTNRIINEVMGVNRVVYDITSKPPGTIEWE
ncbi:glutamine-hydrolyzing GMP synthase [bacterium]|nr:glutamine-hydrolyzing GMP synthase [bacterium]MBU1152561.1 glutamine-hydrolyzing GMP synthase [bacterium]